MAIQEIQGFSTGATVSELGFGGACSTQTTSGRYSGGSLLVSGNGATMTKPFIARSKFGMHFSVFSNDFSNGNAYLWGEVAANTHIQIARNTSNRWQVNYGNSLASSVDTGVTVVHGAWVGIEFYVEISDTVGVLKVWINGSSSPVVNLSGVDTKNGGTGVINQMSLSQPGGGGPSSTFSDWVVYDDQSPATSAPIGDVRVQTIFPTGNGNSSQLVGSDGNSVNNYLLIDEQPYNGDTDYVESSTVGDKDTYAFGDVTPTSGSVLAVQARLAAKKTDAGTREFKPVYRLSGTEVDGTVFTLASGYTVSGLDVRETKPGGGAWSISDVNAAEFGAKVTA